MTATDTVRVLYVAGTGRSGSTLVAQYLEARTHRSLHVGELRYVWERGLRENHLCECGQPFDACPFWTEVLQRAYGAGVYEIAAEIRRLAPDVDRLRWMPNGLFGVGSTYRENLREYGLALVPLYRAIAAVSGCGLIIDSSKDPSYLYALSGLAGLSVLPLHLVRDPRAVAYSWTRKRRRPEIHWEVQYMKTLPPHRAARNWLVYNAAIEALITRRAVGARISYESFAADPDHTSGVALAALGLPSRSVESSTGHGHSLSGNPKRFDEGPVVVRLDREWEHELSRRDRRAVTLITLPLLHHYGYPVR